VEVALSVPIEKRQRMWFRCLGLSRWLFHRSGKRIKAEITSNIRLERCGGKHLVTFPEAQCSGANLQLLSGFRLQDLQLEPAAPEMSADGVRLLWYWYAPVVRW
jgi:hypothetical protein